MRVSQIREKLAQRIPGLYHGSYDEDAHDGQAVVEEHYDNVGRTPSGAGGFHRPKEKVKKAVRFDPTPFHYEFSGHRVELYEAVDVVRRKKRLEDAARLAGTDEELC